MNEKRYVTKNCANVRCNKHADVYFLQQNIRIPLCFKHLNDAIKVSVINEHAFAVEFRDR